MRDLEIITKQAFAITGKLNSIVLEILSHPDREKKIEVLKSLQKRTSAVGQFLFDYVIVTSLKGAGKTL